MKTIGHSSSQTAVFAIAAVWGILCLLTTPVSGQLFGGDGLFNRKNKVKPKGLDSGAEIGIPTPITGKAEALKGSEVAFYIKAETKTPGSIVEFLIRDFPLAGRIVSVVSDPANRSRAIVTYYAEPGTAAATDAFSFAARYRNGRYSPAIRYDIDLIDSISEVTVTPDMDFGKVMIGEEVVKEITARNNGRAPFARQLMVASPWHILEPENGKVVLSPRGTKTIKVAFRPTLEGEVNFILGLSRSKEGLCKLKGEAVLPFSLVSEEVELTLNPETRKRSGVAVFQNFSDKPILLNVRGSARLTKSLGEEVILKPNGETKKEIFLTETDVAGFDGAAEFYLENGFSTTARISAKPVPGEIELEVPGALNSEVINFDKVQAGRTTERGFLVKNIGGEPVPLDYEVASPFRMIASPLKELAPLSSVQVAVEFAPLPGDEGLADVVMKVMTNDQVVPIRLLGNVTKGAGSPRFNLSSGKPKTPAAVQTPVPQAAAVVKPDPSGAVAPQAQSALPPFRVGEESGIISKTNDGRRVDSNIFSAPWLESDLTPEEREKLRSPLGLPVRAIISRDFDDDVRGAEDLEVIKAGPRQITLGFTAPPDSEEYTFELETVGTMIPKNMGEVPIPVWQPYDKVEYKRVGRLVKAKVEVPSPGSDYQFRMISTNLAGKVAPPSNEIVATSAIPFDWTYIYGTCGVLLAIAFFFALRKVILDRRPEVYQPQNL